MEKSTYSVFMKELPERARSVYRFPHKVPESCIESAEFIIQSINNDVATPVWKGGGKALKPHVIATFGGNVKINVSTSDLLSHNIKGLSDYEFDGQLPELGQGLILLRKDTATCPKGYYNSTWAQSSPKKAAK